MAAITNTFITSDAVGNREDLQNAIYSIAPFDTPFMSAIGRENVEGVTHEWQTDSLAAAASNAHNEGFDVSSFTAVSPTTRESNICQISMKDVIVSETQNVVNKAGRTSEVAYQVAKNSKELKRDMEFIVTQNQTPVLTGARKMKALEGWLRTNTSRGTGTTTGTDPSTATTATAGDAGASDLRTFTETILKDVIQKVYSSGGDPSVLMVGPVNKQRVSGFTGRSSAREIVQVGNIQGAASLYASDFGDLSVIPNRFSRERSAFVLDPEYAAIGFLRDFSLVELAKTGDAEKRMLSVEYTLVMRNEAAHGVAADLVTS